MVLSVTDSILSRRVLWDADQEQFVAGGYCWLQSLLPSFLLSKEYKRQNSFTLEKLHEILAKNGEVRMTKICTQCGFDIYEMLSKKLPLRMRDVSKIIHQSKVVTVADLQALTLGLRAKKLGQKHEEADDLSASVMEELGYDRSFVMNLSEKAVDKLYTKLAHPLEGYFQFTPPSKPSLLETIAWRIYKLTTQLFYDPYPRIKKFSIHSETNRQLKVDHYFEKLSLQTPIFEEMDVGTLYPAPNQGEKRRYYRLAAKLITANGQVKFFFLPFGKESGLEPVCFIRGTSFSLSGLDAINYFITDLEYEIGKQGYKSGVKYNKVIAQRFPNIKWNLVGFSAGGCMAQWEAAHQPEKIHKLYLIRSPGVPREVVDQFNILTEVNGYQIDLFIRDARLDVVNCFGERRIGYQAPPSINIHYQDSKQQGLIPHTSKPSLTAALEDIQVFGDADQVNQRLDNTRGPIRWLESFRRCVGGYFLAPIFTLLRNVVRRIFNLRIEGEKGLWIEKITGYTDPIAKIFQPSHYEVVLIKKDEEKFISPS